MEEKYTIGIDFGTLSGRCVIVNVRTGEETAASVFDYPHGVMNDCLPDGTKLGIDWNLQHPGDYIEVLRHTIPDAVKKAGIDVRDIIGIGTDFTACTMLPVDREGMPLCFQNQYRSEPNAYVKLWKHHSAQKYADRLNQIAGERRENFLKRYGGRISSEWMFPKIWQTLEEAYEVYEDTYSFMEAADWIVFYLTGEMKRNCSSAGYKAIWNKREGYPGRDFFKALDPRMEHVAEDKLRGQVVPVGSRAGFLKSELAIELGLEPGIPVAVGHLDAAGATVGAKITEPGKMLIMMGTSSCHMLLGEKEVNVPGICGLVEDGIIPGAIGYEAGQSCVGDHFQWMVENCVPAGYAGEAAKQGVNLHEYLSRLASGQEVGENGLIALDWWNGNRSVLVDGRLSGLIVGMTLKTKPEDIYRALIEATAYGTRLIIDTFEQHQVPVEEVIVAGGIAEKNPFMMQVYADVTGRKIRIAGSGQNAALSSAIWASVAAGKERGGYDTLAEAVVHMGNLKDKVYEPRSENTAAYDRLYEEYLRLHDYFGRGMNDVMKRLKDLQTKVFMAKVGQNVGKADVGQNMGKADDRQ